MARAAYFTDAPSSSARERWRSARILHSPESGSALVEFALTVPFFLIVFLFCLEVVGYLHQRQLAQTTSREAALRAYKQCSGYSDTSITRTDNGVIERCLNGVAAGAAASLPSSMNVAVNVGLFRCDPPSGPGACVPTLIRSAGDVSSWVAAMGSAQHPFAKLLASQQVAIVVNVTSDYAPLLGITGLTLGTIADVTIL